APFDCARDTPEGGVEAPNSLRCAGLYGDWASKTLAAGVRSFAPAYVLWSDGAVKTRWVRLPPGAKIDVTDPDEWVFPVDTKFFKEFAVGGRRVETRMFWKVAPSTWVKTTYAWSADGSKATRLDTGSGGPPSVGIIDDGGVDGGLDGAAYYEIPSVK